MKFLIQKMWKVFKVKIFKANKKKIKILRKFIKLIIREEKTSKFKTIFIFY